MGAIGVIGLTFAAYMKKVLLIYMAFSVLASSLPSNALWSILRVTNLVQHYQEHKAEGSVENFVAFLVKHYASNHIQEDPANHQKLPFHGHASLDLSLHLVAYLETPSPYFAYLSTILQTSIKVLKPLSAQTFPDAQFSHDIWQPPKSL